MHAVEDKQMFEMYGFNFPYCDFGRMYLVSCIYIPQTVFFLIDLYPTPFFIWPPLFFPHNGILMNLAWPERELLVQNGSAGFHGLELGSPQS